MIEHSLKIVNESNNLRTRLSRCEIIRDHAEALVPYKRKGINTVQPRPSDLLAQVREAKDELIVEAMSEEVEKALQKADLATSTRTRINTQNRAMVKIAEFSR